MSVGRLIFFKNWIDANMEGRNLRELHAAGADALARQCVDDASTMGYAAQDIEADIGERLPAFLAAVMDRKAARRSRKRPVKLGVERP